MVAWVERWNDTIAVEPELPGVWRRKDGGFVVRGRAVEPLTGRLREVRRRLPDCRRAREAATTLEHELAQIRAGACNDAVTMPHFVNWAATVLERKIADGTIAAAGGRAKWKWALETHLVPAFGPVFVDKLTRELVERLKAELLAPRAHAKDDKRERELAGGRYRPQTVNTILAVLRQITAAASDVFNIADPCRKLENVSKRLHRTYTREAPNALLPADLPRFLAAARLKYPEHYAFVFIGFNTGLRPSSLRPLRRSGPNADINWQTGEMFIRRSHTHKAEVMDETKTGRDQVIAMPKQMVETLRWHVDRLDRENERRARRSPLLAQAMSSSELLFPSPPTKWNRGGGHRSPSCLDRMFADLGKELGLGYAITPRCMRRTFQDVCRAEKIEAVVTRSISGHATPEMQMHYSTASADEQRAALAKVIDLAVEREKRAA